MVIHGRRDELELVDRFIEAIGDCGGRMLLEGEPGIGKTTVFRHALERAEECGCTVLVTRPAESESSLAYAGLADLLTDIDDDIVGRLPAPQRYALDVALLRAEVEGRPPDPRAVFTAFLTTLGFLAERGAVLVAVDDLQWLDGPSARALEFVARRLQAQPVGMLAAARVGTGGPSWFDSRVRFAPLTPAALHGLIKERIDWNVSRPTLLRLHEASAGNAFYALEIARRISSSGETSHGEWPIPDDVRDLVGLQLASLPEAVRRSLLLAALASHPTRDLLDERAFETGILTLRDGGRVRFMHPLYASAVSAGATPEERRSAHRELAGRVADPVDRARHLASSVEDPDVEIAAELDAASLQARMRGAPEVAAELEERALELTPSTDAAASARRALGAAAHHVHAGGLARAGALLTALLDGADSPEVRSPALRLLALVRYREESMEESLQLLHAAALEAGDRPELRAPVELDLALGAVAASLDHRIALPYTEAAVAFAERTGDAILVSHALAITSLVDFLVGREIDQARLERALELEDPDPDDVPIEFSATMVAGFLAFYKDDRARSRRLLEPFRARLLERGQEAELTLLTLHLAWLECSAGRLVEAADLARTALESATLGHDATMQLHAQAFTAFVEAHLGDLAGGQRARDVLMRGSESCLPVNWSRAALALSALCADDALAADEALAPLSEFFESYERVDPFLMFQIPDHVEALAAVGRIEHAERLLELFAAGATASGRRWALATVDRCRALLLAARGDFAAALTAAERSVNVYETLDRPFELARSLLVLGRVRRRSKQRGAAAVALDRAADIFEEIGAALWAERARGDLERVGRRGDADDLTPSEARVAELAASGLTNREVAATAFMSQKTVEANLSRVYRKLGIRSRAELGLRLAERAHTS